MKSNDIKVVSPETIREFDKFLADRQLHFEGVIVGAASLALSKYTERGTKDCDVLDPEIPKDVKEASVEFAVIMRKKGIPLLDDWFNNGPASLKRTLPGGWRDVLEQVFDGDALKLQSLDRLTMLKTKLFAYCDRGIDLEDCLALNPTWSELQKAMPWVQEQDGNPMWPSHVADMIDELADRMGLEKEKTRDLDRGGGYGHGS